MAPVRPRGRRQRSGSVGSVGSVEKGMGAQSVALAIHGARGSARIVHPMAELCPSGPGASAPLAALPAGEIAAATANLPALEQEHR